VGEPHGTILWHAPSSRHHGEAETHELNDRAIRDRLSQPDFSVTWRINRIRSAENGFSRISSDLSPLTERLPENRQPYTFG